MAETTPGSSEVAQRAIATFKQQQFDEAIPLLRQAIEFDKDSFKLWMYLGAALGHREKWADAERAFAKAEEIDGSSAEASYMLGIAIAKQGRLREAHGQFMVALGNDPNHAKAKAAAEKTAAAAAQVTKDGSSAAAPGGLAGLDL
ncbi:MAG: tetratricopeptide repeat protein, partial [Armatimonadetes bacterium]|nr:tetratricopeptide repeat protein [Armatimonadota bacterium]